MQMTGAEMVVQLLERHGVQWVAGIPGGANLPLYDALSRSSIRHVLARHEQGAGFIAQGMARVTGKPGVCLATSGPGATNLMTAVADARLDSVPLVCLTGQVPRALMGADAFQEIDTYGISVPITKHNFLARNATELLDIIPHAFQIAAAGRPGPVLVDIPKDVQTEAAEFDELPLPRAALPAPAPEREVIDRAAWLIDFSHRPLLYLGGGVVRAQAGETCTRLAELADIPMVTTLMALGAVGADHPLSLGMMGMHGAPCANLAVAQCDLLIAVGARFDDRATGRLDRFCPEARIIHIDIDEAEIGKNRRPDVGLTGDAATVVRELAARVTPTARGRWRRTIARLQCEHPLRLPGERDIRTPYGLIRALAGLAPEDAIVVTDVGQHQMWVAQAYPLQHPRRWLTSGGLGTMGFGLPAAIGAALACPERKAICFTGDGSLLMNLQELATAAEEGVQVMVVVMNNRSLGLVRQQQDLFYGGRAFACDFAADVDFVRLARAFGTEAWDLNDASDPHAILARALSADGPTLIHASIDTHAKVFPMVPPGAANTEMIGAHADVGHA